MQRCCLILCRSLTYAQRAALALERAGITATVRRAPQELSGAGCAYGMKLKQTDLERARALLDRGTYRIGKTYLLEADGSAREVSP